MAENPYMQLLCFEQKTSIKLIKLSTIMWNWALNSKKKTQDGE